MPPHLAVIELFEPYALFRKMRAWTAAHDEIREPVENSPADSSLEGNGEEPDSPDTE